MSKADTLKELNDTLYSDTPSLYNDGIDVVTMMLSNYMSGDELKDFLEFVKDEI